MEEQSIEERGKSKNCWILGRNKNKCVIELPDDNMPGLKNHHLVVIEFLYNNFMKKGSIINSEDGLDIQFQVTLFMKAIERLCSDSRYFVLLLVPDQLLIKWHYHLTVHGGLLVKIITEDDSAEVNTELIKTAILLPFSNIKRAEYLLEYDYSLIVVDQLDEVANKLILKKISGVFNIGLTGRNFYLQPNQKLQWAMLNWTNPDCVGKLADFYEIDNDNFASFRDNYRFWWLRLTWNFCESFERKTEDEIEKYNKLLADWASSHELLEYQFHDQRTKPRNERREASDIDKNTKEKTDSGSSQRNAKVTGKSQLRKFAISKNNIDNISVSENTREENNEYNHLQQLTNCTSKRRERSEVEFITDLQEYQKKTSVADLSGNIVVSSVKYGRTENNPVQSQMAQTYLASTSKARTSENVMRDETKFVSCLKELETQINMHEKHINCKQKSKSESIEMDDNPMLSFLMDNDDSDKNQDTQLNLHTQLCDKEMSFDDDGDILRSIMDDTGSKTTTIIQEDSDLFYRKEEILSQIYDTDDRTANAGNDFLSSFINS